jgi:hypothetical protein
MFKSLAASAIACSVVLGTPALAQGQGWWDEHPGSDERHGGGENQGGGRYGNHGQAPEPLVALGLSLGVAGIAAARLVSNRKSKHKG